MIKIIKNILIGLLTFIISINALVYVLLSIPSIQNKLTLFATNELKTRLKTEVRIKEVDFEFLNKLVLKDVYLTDRSGNELLRANRMSVGIELFELLHNRLIINTLQLYSFQIHISKETPKSIPNYQFIFDALKSDTTKKSKGLSEIQIKSIIIRRGSVNYDVWSQPNRLGQFNSNHIRVFNLLASISLHTFTKDSVNAEIKKFAFDEQSGIVLKKLSMQFVANKKQAILKNFALKMTSSSLELKNIYLDYSKVDAKHPFSDYAKFNVDIPKAQVCLHDFAPFVPIFQNYYDILYIEAGFGGTVNSFDLRNLKINSGQRLRVSAQLHLAGITDLKNAYLFGKVKEMHIAPDGFAEVLKNLSIRYEDLVKLATRAGQIQFNGEISGYFSDLVAFGTLKSELGTIRTDLKIGKDTIKNQATFSGKLVTELFNIGRLLDNKSLGIVSLNLLVDGYQNYKSLPQGKIEGEIFKVDLNQYQYKNIKLNGQFEGTRYDGKLEIDDPNGYVLLNGIVDTDPKERLYNVNATVRGVKLEALHLSNKYPNSSISFSMKTDLSGNFPDNTVGEVRFDSILFIKNNEQLFLNQVSLVSSNQNNQKRIIIVSPFVNGEIKGQYNFASLPNSVMYLLSKYVPSVTHAVPETKSQNDFDFSFRVSNTEKLSEILQLPITFYDETILKGAYSDYTNRFFLESNIPSIKWGNTIYNSASLVANNDDEKAYLTAKLITTNKKNDHINVAFNLTAKDDAADCKLNWSNSGIQTYSGILDLHSKFLERSKSALPAFDVDIRPSSFIFNDTTWQISPSNVLVDSSRVTVRNFAISKPDQYLKFDGCVSKSTKDTLNLSLKNINLDYIFNTVNINKVHFGGNATGDFVLTNLLKDPILLTNNLVVNDFAFNNTRFGNLRLYSEWDAPKSGILMKGTLDGYLGNKSALHGYIFPTKDSISMDIDANNLNIDFLRVYLGGILKDLSGYASGKALLIGKFSNLSVIGDVKLQDFRFGIDYLNTYFTLNDSIHLRHNSIYFNNVNLLDKDKNVAIASGMIQHKYLSDWRYSIQMNTSNILAFNATSRQNPIFYGPVYAAGRVSINGNDAFTNIDVNLQTNIGTKFVVSLNDQKSASEYNFITFRNRNQELLDLQKEEELELRKKMPQLFEKTKISTNELNINLLVDIKPASNLSLVMDPNTGDMIETNGSGNLRLAYNNKKDVQMFGTYTIERGNYGFSFQNFIKKRFAIKEGSTVTFRGDPYSADLGIKAIYTTTADITDLDESFATDKDISRTSTQVQCVLDITGDMLKPDLKFDLNLPNNTEEVNRRVKSIVNTDDMMARQIVYLLSINRFYTPDYLNTGAARANQLSSLASATLSSQFNNVISQITDKVNIGTNLKLDNTAYTNMEVEVALSSQLLNNRLLVNGNLGYRDNISNKATFIGDFDLEYKLTKSGDFRVKGYNHTNDRYYYIKSSLTTQGLGLIYKKDFDNLLDLFRKKIKSP